MTGICVTLFVLVFALPGYAAGAEGRPAQQSMFDDADANDDGAVSREEFVLARAARFARIDRNEDGYFDDSDLPKRLLKRRKAGAGRVRARFDADGDGKVSKDEFVNGPTPVFDNADANGDGELNKQELADAKAAAKEWHPDGAGNDGGN